MTSTFQTALTSGNYDSLRGTNANGGNRWAAYQYITLCKNTVVFQAQANGAISSTSFASIPFHTVSVGAYTDIEEGETFFISHDSNIRHYYYRGRVRVGTTSSALKVNETSVNITDGDYLFVVYDFDVWDRLSRMVGSTQYQDYDVAFQTLPSVTVGLQTAYINYDTSNAAYRIAFNVSSSYRTSYESSGSLTYQFTFKASTYTVISGALNTSAVTVDFNANTEQWGKLVVTDSQGVSWTRRFYIRCHGSTDTPALDFSGAQISGSVDSGWNATVSAWAGVSSVLDQTFTVIWSQEYYNNVSGSLYNNIDMVGRFHREENHGAGDAQYSYLADVKFEIEGIHSQMARLQEQDLTTVNVTPPSTAWDQIGFNTPQRSIVYYLAWHSTVLNLCDLTFPLGFDLTYFFAYVPNQGGNVMDAVKGIAAQVNAYVEFAPDGRIQVVRDTRFLSDKSGVVVVGNFDNRDFTALDPLSVDPVQKTGRLDAYGVSYNAGVIAVRSRAPGVAQGYAAGQSQLDNQILAANQNQDIGQAELNYRAGQQLAIDNMTYTQTWKAAHGGYHFLIPSRGQRVTHLYSTATNVRGRSFGTSDYWQVVSISISHDNASGAREVSTVEELEPPIGDSGDTVPIIAGGTLDNPIALQPLDPFPNLPDNLGNYLPDNPTPTPYPTLIPPKNGDTVIYTDGSLVDTSRSAIAYTMPTWTGATPSDLGAYVVKAVCFDLTTNAPPIGAYVLASDGTNSAVWHTADAFATPVVWAKGADVTGVYTGIRSASTAGSIEIYNPASAGTPTTVTVTFDAGGYAYTIIAGTVTSGGNPGNCLDGGLGDPTNAHAEIDLGSIQTVTGMSFDWKKANAANIGADLYLYDNSHTLITSYVGFFNTPTNTWTTFSSGAINVAGVRYAGFQAFSSGVPSLEDYIDNLTVSYGGGNATTRLSTDYGATFASAVTVGTSPGANGGFDLLRIGAVTLAAAAGQAKIATTLGGAYSNAAGGTLSSGDPVSLVLPYRRLPHGATQFSVTNPDYMIGSSAIISSSCLWDVDGATGTKTNVNPVAGATCVGPNLLSVWQSSTTRKIAVVVSVSGVYKVYVWNGSAWSFSRNVTTPIFLRCRRNDPNGTQLYLLDGATLYVSTNWGVSWASRTLPSTNNSVNMDVYY